MNDDIDPLREYMRVVRTLNIHKLRLFSIDRKIRDSRRSLQRDVLEGHRGQVLEEIRRLLAEGERYLAQMRDEPDGGR